MSEPAKCGACGATLIELERFHVALEDFELKARKDLGRPLRPSERQRFQQAIGEGWWRQLGCPKGHDVGFLVERISDGD